MDAVRKLIGALAVLALATTAAFAQSWPTPGPASGARTFTGAAQPLGQGRIFTWVTVDRDHRPLALGVTLTERALQGLPNTRPHAETVLDFPPQAAAAGLPFTHFVVNWNPAGHFPHQVYGAPHFDFHFYTLSPAVRRAMTLQGENRALALRTPPPAAVPPGYLTVPGAEEPYMGVHWVDANTPELHGRAFDQTFVYGYYAGQLAFLEPMLTPVFLRSRPNLVAPIKVPALYPAAGYYPTQYSIRSDPRAETYTIALERFALRPAGTPSVTAALPPPTIWCPPGA